MQVVRRIALAVAAAVVAGALMGAVARVMMRLATLAAGHDSGFSVGGTLSILVIFTVFALPGSLLAAFVGRRGRSTLLVLGALALCLPAASIATTDLGGLSGLSALQWVGVGLSTVGIYVAIAGLPLLALRVIRAGTRSHATPVTAVSVDPVQA